MVTRSTRGWVSQRASSACSTRAVVDLPTATLPATPMTNGTGRSRSAFAEERRRSRRTAAAGRRPADGSAGPAAGRPLRPRAGRVCSPRPRRLRRVRPRSASAASTCAVRAIDFGRTPRTGSARAPMVASAAARSGRVTLLRVIGGIGQATPRRHRHAGWAIVECSARERHDDAESSPNTCCSVWASTGSKKASSTPSPATPRCARRSRRAGARPGRPGPSAPPRCAIELPAGLDAGARRLRRRAPAGAGVLGAQVRRRGRRIRRRGARLLRRRHRPGDPDALPRGARRAGRGARRRRRPGPLSDAYRSIAGRGDPAGPARRLHPRRSRAPARRGARRRTRCPTPRPSTTRSSPTSRGRGSTTTWATTARTVAINADLKQQMSNLPRLVAHESYPGPPHRALPQGGRPGRRRAGRADDLPGQHPAVPDGRGAGRPGAVRRDRAGVGRLGGRDLRRPGAAVRRRARRAAVGEASAALVDVRQDAALMLHDEHRDVDERRGSSCSAGCWSTTTVPGRCCGSCRRRCGARTSAPTSRATGCCGAGWTPAAPGPGRSPSGSAGCSTSR